jgi:hypothetical protein
MHMYRLLIGGKVTNKCTVIVYFFLKCIYLFTTSTFRLFPSHHQSAYVAQRKNNVYIFQDAVIYISVLHSNLTFVKIINKILKMFNCLTLFCVVVCVLRDGWLRNFSPV